MKQNTKLERTLNYFDETYSRDLLESYGNENLISLSKEFKKYILKKSTTFICGNNASKVLAYLRQIDLNLGLDLSKSRDGFNVDTYLK